MATQTHTHLIRNDQQALADELFRDVTAVVATRTFLAHIRKATVGEISVLNCHPFQHGAWAMIHNGEIIGYAKDESIRRRVNELVDERFRRHILGKTDSEVSAQETTRSPRWIPSARSAWARRLPARLSSLWVSVSLPSEAARRSGTTSALRRNTSPISSERA